MAARSIRHPGAASEPRVLAQACTARRLTLRFQPGKPVLDAVAEALSSQGIDSAVIEMDMGSLAPLVYVVPAPSPDEAHAAWYSETRRPGGIGQIERLTMSFGRREGAPFIHCHGIWKHADGFRGAGHLIPHESAFGAEVEGTVYAISGAILDQQADAETNFPLLTPVPSGTLRNEEASAVLLRIKPNTDIHAAIEDVARAHSFDHATLHGNCSLVGCDFADGSHMSSYASEAFLRSSYVKKGKATVDIGVVGMDGKIFQGIIARGGNVVCIACEILIVQKSKKSAKRIVE